jgi:predicted transcriptional regulator
MNLIGKQVSFVVILAVLALAMSMSVSADSSMLINFDKIPEQYQEFVPEEVKKLVANLTDEDKAVLKELAGKHGEFQTEDQVMEAVKEKSPALYEKINTLRTLVKSKIDSLQPDAKAFVTGLIEKVKALKPKGDEKPNLNKLREAANQVIEQYKALSQEAKDNLKATFPQITSVIQNEKFQKLAQSLLKTGEEAPAPAAGA